MRIDSGPGQLETHEWCPILIWTGRIEMTKMGEIEAVVQEVIHTENLNPTKNVAMGSSMSEQKEKKLN